MLDDLDDSQRDAATAPLGPLRILAGPGAGKTRTLTARIAHLVTTGQVQPDRILALSHTTKAAGNLRDRLTLAGVGQVTSSTFHAAALYQLRHLWTAYSNQPLPQLLPSVYSHVRAAAESVHKRRLEQAELLDMVSEIDWARARLLNPGTYRAAARRENRPAPTNDHALVQRTWEAYTKAKRAENLMDFADVVSLATEMLADPEIAPRVHDRWRAFFVDEYQDVDPAQQKLLDAWLSGRDALTVVADPNQSIFGFKGADPTLLDTMPSRLPGTTTVELTRNYRATPELLTWVNAVRTVKNRTLVSTAPPGPRPVLVESRTEDEELTALVHQIRAWLASGVAAEEIAVLYRFNATAARVESALLAAGVPYHTLGAVRFFTRPEIADALAALSALATERPDTPAHSAMHHALSQVGFDPLRIPDGAGAARTRYESLLALRDLVTQHANTLTASDLVRELTRRARDAHEPTPGGVRLCTVHAAKGLEFDAVWVIGAVEGQMPSAFAKLQAALTEEQNVFYVAISRARTHLTVSWAARRSNNWSQKPSRYLALLAPTSRNAPRRSNRPASTTDISGLSAKTKALLDSIGNCQTCGSRLTGPVARSTHRCSPACLDASQREFHDRLLAWRSARAEARDCTPREIATDRALFQYAATGSSDAVRGLADTVELPRP